MFFFLQRWEKLQLASRVTSVDPLATPFVFARAAALLKVVGSNTTSALIPSLYVRKCFGCHHALRLKHLTP